MAEEGCEEVEPAGRGLDAGADAAGADPEVAAAWEALHADKTSLLILLLAFPGFFSDTCFTKEYLCGKVDGYLTFMCCLHFFVPFQMTQM